MDWSKAKTILIVAFLITNIILGFVVLSSERQEESTIKQSFIEDVIDILGKKNISIDTEIPKEAPTLNTLEVEYEVLDSDRVNKDFFNGKGNFDFEDRDLIEISKGSESVTVIKNKILKYENNNNEIIYKDIDKEKATDIGMEFLEDKKYDLSDMKLYFIKEKDNEYTLEFSKVYGDRYLETAYTSMEIDARGVKSLERLWLNALDEGDTPIYINAAPKAILELISMEEAYGKNIVDISLSYYFEPKKNEYIEEVQDARKGKTIPAWRVLFDDGYKIVIDNY